MPPATQAHFHRCRNNHRTGSGPARTPKKSQQATKITRACCTRVGRGGQACCSSRPSFSPRRASGGAV
eukprot:9388810-Alexandrium_andersonii.AAC.1